MSQSRLLICRLGKKKKKKKKLILSSETIGEVEIMKFPSFLFGVYTDILTFYVNFNNWIKDDDNKMKKKKKEKNRWNSDK